MNHTVIGVPEFNRQFEELEKTAKEGNGASAILLKKLRKGVDKLKNNYRAGKHIPKDRIPQHYKTKFGVTNLWKLNIDPVFRLVYTVRGTEAEVMTVILEFFDHKAYEKRFGYRG